MEEPATTDTVLIVGLDPERAKLLESMLHELGLDAGAVVLADRSDLVWADDADEDTDLRQILTSVLQGIHLQRGLSGAMQEVRLLEAAMDQAKDGMFITDADTGARGPKILWCNESFATLVGRSRAALLSSHLLADGPLGDVRNTLQRALSRARPWEGEVVHGHIDAPCHLALQLSAVRSADGTATNHIGVMRDVTANKRAEDRLQHLAHHDHLTGLPNRKLLLDRLTQATARARRYKTPLAVLFLDLDGFKIVNDTLGHATGDRVLVAVSERLGRLVRASDTVSRLGGDEFVVLLSEIRTAQDAQRVAQKIIKQVSEVLRIDADEIFITPSIGIAVWPDHAQSADQLLRRADQAMYAAKSAGKARSVTWTEELDASSRGRADLTSALSQALERGELHLDAQPIMQIGGRQIAVETLLRWTRPDHGAVSPATFVPLLGAAGLEPKILPWIISQIAPLIADTTLCAAVDVRPRWLDHPGSVEALHSALVKAGLPPDRLWVEVAEGQLLEMPPEQAQRLDSIRALGAKVIVNHYGTSHLSVPQLRSLPLNAVKLDGSLTHDVAEEHALIRGLVTLCDSLGLDVLADGVHLLTQRDALADLGISHQSGPLHGGPQALEEAAKAWPRERSSAS